MCACHNACEVREQLSEFGSFLHLGAKLRSSGIVASTLVIESSCWFYPESGVELVVHLFR